MTTSSEDVLLQVSDVRYKKGEGTLYIMNERVAWILDHRDTVAVSHHYADIKTQKISPDGKPKVQLQLVLHDSSSTTFHFVNPRGVSAQRDDRDKVKERLQQLLPNFKRKVDKDLEEKHRLLQENATLMQLYKDLVISRVIPSEQFWETHAKEFAAKHDVVEQDIGVSGAFLADVKPQFDGCNGLKYNLTSDIVHNIFKTYPAVKRKHIENVPAKMSEEEFWTKFFQSHYFHRDRLTTGSKDMFSECGKIDDQMHKKAVEQCAGDPLLDIRRFDDAALEEGFGGFYNNAPHANSGNIVHQSLIKRFNLHSMMVLQTCTDIAAPSKSGSVGPIPSATTTTKKPADKHAAAEIGEQVTVSDEPAKKQRLLAKIYYDDLGEPAVNTATEARKTERVAPPINIDRYLHGPAANRDDDTRLTPDAVARTEAALRDSTRTWLQRPPQKVLVSSRDAVHALGELSPGGALMRNFQDRSVGQLVPKDFEREMRSLYIALSELLRDFWSCFPVTSDELTAKVHGAHEALQRFKTAKLVDFENRVQAVVAPSLVKHMDSQIKEAHTKYTSWSIQSKRAHR